VIDTLVLARRKHPGGHDTLDDLCASYGVNSLRSVAIKRANLFAIGNRWKLFGCLA
jgi:DNA polymerase III epsilon subunit-like protein